MTALGIEFSSRDADLFYWPAPSTHGKSPEYAVVSDKIEELWARYIGICEYAPQEKLDEIQDEINRLEKEKEYLYKRDQMAISNKRNQLETVTSDKATVSA
jgi:cupin superfamily acireductone dioxygenase involved in methionine salvage